MSWLDDLIEWGSNAYQTARPYVDSAVDFASKNPTATGAALGLITGGGTGNYGSANLRNALTGGAVGYTAGQLFGNSTPSQAAAGMEPRAGSNPSWVPTSTGNPNAFSTAVSNANPVGGGSQYFGAEVGDGFSSVGGNFATGGGSAGFGMDDIQSGIKKVQDFGQKYETPIKVGMQGMATLDKRQRLKDTESMLRGQADQEAAFNADNRRIVDDSNAAERAYSVMAPKNAFSNVMNATARKVQAAGMDPMQTETQAAARKRQLALAGTAGATTAAANATYQPRLQKYDAPRTSAAQQAAQYGADADSSLWKDYWALGRTALGWDDKDRKQVTG